MSEVFDQARTEQARADRGVAHPFLSKEELEGPAPTEETPEPKVTVKKPRRARTPKPKTVDWATSFGWKASAKK